MESKKLIVAGSALALPALLLQSYFHGNGYSLLHSYSLGMFFGIISYSLLSLSVITSCRIKWIEKIFGQDKLIRFHGITAGIAFVAALFHLVFKLKFNAEPSVQIATGMAAFSLFALLSIMTHLFMIRSPLRKLIPTKILETIAIRYNTAKTLHNGMILMFTLVIIHVLFAWSTAEQSLRMVAIHLTGWGTILCYLNFRIIRPMNMPRATVTAVTACSPSMISVTLRLEQPLQWSAGQFAYLTFSKSSAGREEHPFTIASAPHQSNEIEFVIKKSGLFTERLANLAVGTGARIDGPYGTFTPSADAPLLFVAGGVGITPFLSILRQWVSEQKVLTNPVMLIWSATTESEIPFAEELRAMERILGKFSVKTFLTREQNGARITGSDIIAAIERLRETASPELWFCAPSHLQDLVLSAGKTAGVKRRAIHFEKFTS